MRNSWNKVFGNNEVEVKVKPIAGGRYSATIFDWYYATGDTPKEAIKRVVTLLEKEIGYR